MSEKFIDQGMSADALQGAGRIEYGPHLTSAIKSSHFDYQVDGEFAKVLVMVKISNAHGVKRIILDIPGGKRELGESSVECALREVYEEAHIRLDRQLLEEAVTDDTVETCGQFYFVRD
jgi:8-oxo-dGTP pyrophosphatase MutT (NUDIX family)